MAEDGPGGRVAPPGRLGQPVLAGDQPPGPHRMGPDRVSRWVGTTVASSPASTARSGSDGRARWSHVKSNTVDPPAVATSAISTATG